MSFDRPTDVDVLSALRRDLVAGVRTSLVGVVVSYNATLRTCKVQPARRGRTTDGQSFDLPIIPNAKVLWPRHAGIVRVGRLNPGDKVLAIVCDREIDGFLLSGAPYQAKSQRTHALTDAVVLPGVDLQTTLPITVGDAGAMEYWGREDGTAYVQIPIDVPAQIEVEGGPAGIRLGAASVDFALLGTTFVTAMTTYTAAIAALAISSPPGTALQNAAFLSGFISITADLAADIVNWLATKVLVE